MSNLRSEKSTFTMGRIGTAIGGTFIGMICCGILSGFFAFLLSPIFDALIGAGGSTMSAHPVGVFIYAAIPSGFVGAILGFIVGALQIPKKLSAAIGGLLGLSIVLSFGIAALSFVFAGAITGYVVATLTQLELD